jgi:hypothetical protein
MPHNWMPLFGEFTIRDEIIKFKGRQLFPTQPPPDPQQGQEVFGAVGILLTNRTMTNGRLSAEVIFEQVTPRSVCDLILGYDLDTKSQVSAGLGGGGAMFGIREWVPSVPVGGQGSPGGAWKPYEITGDRANLLPNRPYQIEARVTGSRVTLHVDKVHVGSATLPVRPNHPQQTGVFCVSESEITINSFHVQSERPKAFVVMQFSSPYNEVYSQVIRQVCNEFEIDPLRADEMYGSGIVIKDVIDEIARSQIVIAEISPANPNVYFEVGYALALQKPIILLAQRNGADARLPFDLSAFRVLFYDDSIAGKPKVEEGLRRNLREILGEA